MSQEQKTPRHPAIELLSKYRAELASAWKSRHEMMGPQRLVDEAAFLPAALSLQETPVHPAPRRLAYLLMGLFALALLWSIFGKVDIVAIAPGRIIVSDHTKTIQPLEVSVVRRVLVRDGDQVQAGQVLIELDPTNANADSTSVQEQLSATVSEEIRTATLLNALENSGQSVHLEIDEEKFDTPMRAQLLAEWSDIRAKLSKFQSEADRRRAEIATVKQTIAKLVATLPIAKAREADFTELQKGGYVASHAAQDKTRERIEMQSDLATQRARLVESQSALREAEESKRAYQAETVKLLSERNAQAKVKRGQFAQDQIKAQQKERLTQLTAPVAGTIQQLAIHTTGGVVTAAQPLMIVVPAAAKVTADVNIANQDIGFVNAGGKATVKLETFPFTKYGTVDATVDMVTADAVTDEKKGSYYPARLTLAQKEMNIDGKRVPLSPGMNVTAEIKIGQRRVIEYLLSPIQKVAKESLRER